MLATGFAVAVVFGCGGPEKELPRDVTAPTERGKESPPPATVPGVSQPEAVKVIEKCLATVTDGHPERLQRVKTSRQFVRGKWRWPNDFIADATREVQSVWPDRARFAYEFSNGEIKKFLILFRRPALDSYFDDGSGPKEFKPVNPKEFADTVKTDAVGEHWLPLLIPFTDPKTIVFDHKKEPYGPGVADTIKVSVPNCPIFTVWFSEKTGRPGLITYVDFEAGSRILKNVILDKYKAFEGINLPTQIESRRNGVTVQEWTVLKWEFPDKIEDSMFDSSSKK
jgi:hypothetical protein